MINLGMLLYIWLFIRISSSQNNVLVTRNFSYEEWSECLRMWVSGGLGIYLSLVLTLNAAYNYSVSIHVSLVIYYLNLD